MKKPNIICRARIAAIGLMLTLTAACWAANTKTTVEQVTTEVALVEDVDYIVTSDSPFAEGGLINIVNTDHAVVILQNVKPSKAASLVASHIQINGQRASNNQNCQIKLYNRGCIIMPYGKDFRPLTVYAEQNFQGETYDNFGLEHTGGFMNTLTDEKLNNRIRSFRLKRGYMVTFSLRPNGRGYSRCFIAADKDLEVAVLPAILDRSISSYRVFRWFDTGKPQLAAAGGDNNACAMLNVTSTYSWNAGADMLPNVECVPHQIYSGYPGAGSCGSVSYSPHLKTSNEPRNSADDHPEDLNAILNNWESLMATGMRLCSPSSWDGSDYWNGTGFLKQFFDSIDARGWRCDIVDMHCYWAEGSFPNLRNWLNNVRRPVWISEWCWGASWNSNGAFANGVTENAVRNALSGICATLNSYDYVERYFYWNGERDPSKLIKNGQLTPAGTMYAQLDGGVGYNGKYDFVPKAPQQKDPSDLIVDYDKQTGQATLTWTDYNGEQNEGIYVERRANNTSKWDVIADVRMQEGAAQYTFVDSEATNGCQYRVRIVDANGKERTTKTVMAASGDLKTGDAVQVDGKTMYLGGNLFINGDFDLGTYGWLNGNDQPIGAPWFQVVPTGGYDGGAYLQSYGHGTANETAVFNKFELEQNADYYFSGTVCNTSSVLSRLLAESDELSRHQVAFFNNPTTNWQPQFATFNSEAYTRAILSLANLGSKTQFDKLMLCRLYSTQEEAIADGIGKARQKAQVFITLHTPAEDATVMPAEDALMRRLTSVLAHHAEGTDAETLRAIDDATTQTIRACNLLPLLQALCTRATALADYQLPGATDLQTAILATADVLNSGNAADIIDQLDVLQDAINAYMPLADQTGSIKSPSFLGSAYGWNTKTGTYQGGDQRPNNKDGISFWNAWWAISAKGNVDQTMAISQTVSGLEPGLYAIECKAATEHFCQTDQHAYITHGEETLLTPALTADYLDLPTVSNADRWQTLTSLPLYVEDGGTVTIGFVGSKHNAIDGMWRELGNTSSKGDNREGWWAATDFVLKYYPQYRLTAEPGQWGVICLPCTFEPSDGLKIFQIAGITANCTRLCLEQPIEIVAGMPYIYRADAADVVFNEYGTPATKTTDGPGGLRGFLKTSATEAMDYYALKNGEWVKVTRDNRERMSNYTALIRPLTDKSSTMTYIAEWNGETMPISGVTDEEKAAGIVSTAITQTDEPLYTIDGRRVKGQPRKGFYIRGNKKFTIK